MIATDILEKRPPKLANRGFTLLNAVVWLAMSALLSAFVPLAFSALSAKANARTAATLEQAAAANVCHFNESDTEEKK